MMKIIVRCSPTDDRIRREASGDPRLVLLFLIFLSFLEFTEVYACFIVLQSQLTVLTNAIQQSYSSLTGPHFGFFGAVGVHCIVPLQEV